jgi:hypothetical protein
MAIVGLSREASSTFHEESRIATTEMQLRTAIDRLRADVERASFMSTGNIFIDPQINTTPGTTSNVNQGVYTNAAAYSNTNDMSLRDLAGIRLFRAGSNSPTVATIYPQLTLSTVNFGSSPGVGPDTIEIGGNMTGVEVVSIGAPAGKTAIESASVCGGGQRVHLDIQNNPALWRLVGMSPSVPAATADATYQAALTNAFEPANPTNTNPPKDYSFIVRIVDNTTGKTQYAATCAGTGAITWSAGGTDAWVDLDSSSPNITLSGVSPNATINPVQIVRWTIAQSTLNAEAGSGQKYDLQRQFLDSSGNAAGSPEIIAEYAVDLKFAFSIDTLGNATGDYSQVASSPIVVNSFDDSTNNAATSNQTVAGDVASSLTGTTAPNGPYPQRIRSVRIRLATRAAIQDRAQPLSAGGDYLYRYCVNTAGCDDGGTPDYARTRTLITEVSLPNQATLWFQ